MQRKALSFNSLIRWKDHSRLVSVRKVRRPDVPGEFAEINCNFIAGHRNLYHATGTNIAYGQATPVKVRNGRRRPGRSFGVCGESLGPQAIETVAIRDEVDHIPIR